MTSFLGVFAALRVSSAIAECPSESAILERLAAQGITMPAADVDLRFAREDAVWVATITTSDAAPRRLESRAETCASLGDAAVALLAVLFDETPQAPPPPPAPPPPSETARVQAEAEMLASTGVIADVALGAGIGVAWRPTSFASIGLLAETWPARDHAAGGGRVSVAASTFALNACIEHRRSIGVAACAFGHAGFYSLTADGFDVVHPETRGLYAAEADGRLTVPIAGAFAVFLRMGVWVPFTRLDVAVAGTDAAYRTTSFGTKGGFGLELRR